MPDDIQTKYCKRIGKNVYAESMGDLTGRVLVFCEYYNSGPCIKDSTNKKCLVRLAVKREEKSKLSSQIFS